MTKNNRTIFRVSFFGWTIKGSWILLAQLWGNCIICNIAPRSYITGNLSHRIYAPDKKVLSPFNYRDILFTLQLEFRWIVMEKNANLFDLQVNEIGILGQRSLGKRMMQCVWKQWTWTLHIWNTHIMVCKEIYLMSKILMLFQKHKRECKAPQDQLCLLTVCGN